MVWKVYVERKDSDMVWFDDDSGRFIHLKPFDGFQWIVRVGVKDSVSHNQERLFKNRSRAMISINNFMRTKNWRISF